MRDAASVATRLLARGTGSEIGLSGGALTPLNIMLVKSDTQHHERYTVIVLCFRRWFLGEWF